MCPPCGLCSASTLGFCFEHYIMHINIMDPCSQSLHDSKLPFQLLPTEKVSPVPLGRELPVFFLSIAV